jgi:hypothetical protein
MWGVVTRMTGRTRVAMGVSTVVETFGGPSHRPMGVLSGACVEGVLRSLRYRIALSAKEKVLEGAEPRGRGGGTRG